MNLIGRSCAPLAPRCRRSRSSRAAAGDGADRTTTYVADSPRRSSSRPSSAGGGGRLAAAAAGAAAALGDGGAGLGLGPGAPAIVLLPPKAKSLQQWDSGARYDAKHAAQAEMRFRAREYEQRITREQVGTAASGCRAAYESGSELFALRSCACCSTGARALMADRSRCTYYRLPAAALTRPMVLLPLDPFDHLPV